MTNAETSITRNLEHLIWTTLIIANGAKLGIENIERRIENIKLTRVPYAVKNFRRVRAVNLNTACRVCTNIDMRIRIGNTTLAEEVIFR